MRGERLTTSGQSLALRAWQAKHPTPQAKPDHRSRHWPRTKPHQRPKVSPKARSQTSSALVVTTTKTRKATRQHSEQFIRSNSCVERGTQLTATREGFSSGEVGAVIEQQRVHEVPSNAPSVLKRIERQIAFVIAGVRIWRQGNHVWLK